MVTNCNRNCPSTKDLYDHGEIAGIFISVDDYKNDNSPPGLDYGSAFLIMQERHVDMEVHIRNLFPIS
jgi:hypothetical protein